MFINWGPNINILWIYIVYALSRRLISQIYLLSTRVLTPSKERKNGFMPFPWAFTVKTEYEFSFNDVQNLLNPKFIIQ